MTSMHGTREIGVSHHKVISVNSGHQDFQDVEKNIYIYILIYWAIYIYICRYLFLDVSTKGVFDMFSTRMPIITRFVGDPFFCFPFKCGFWIRSKVCQYYRFLYSPKPTKQETLERSIQELRDPSRWKTSRVIGVPTTFSSYPCVFFQTWWSGFGATNVKKTC